MITLNVWPRLVATLEVALMEASVALLFLLPFAQVLLVSKAQKFSIGQLRHACARHVFQQLTDGRTVVLRRVRILLVFPLPLPFGSFGGIGGGAVSLPPWDCI